MTEAISRDPIYRRRRYPPEVIELCVRWYITYRLSYRDLVATSCSATILAMTWTRRRAMSNRDPIGRLPSAFGELLARRRLEQKLTTEALAVAAGLPDAAAVTMMERGEREPTLTDLFRIADTLRMPHAILYIDVIAAWRADPADLSFYKSRASDFGRLYRLGYHHDPGDFRELPRTYGLLDLATGDARMLNATRRSKRLPLLDTVLIYVRLGHVPFRTDEEE